MHNVFTQENIVIFDMECTDFVLDENVLVQFSARKYEGNKMVDKINILIDNKFIDLNLEFKQRSRLNYKILKQRGIPLDQALEQIKEFISNYTLVTYKGNFFYLQMLWFLFNYELKNPTLDIVDIAKELKIINDPDAISLEDLSISLNLDFAENKWYNASHDVVAIEKIWFKLKSMYQQGDK